ncbi:S9 family peptidase [Asaia astilbis]
MPESRSQENSSDGFHRIILNPMTNPSSIPSGSWPSWVSPDLVAGRSVSLSDLQAEGDRLYWLEGRPQERGRTALVSLKRNEAPQDLLPTTHDVGTRVHEYGGGAYRVSQGQHVVFSDRKSGQVWLRGNDGSLVAFASTPGCAYTEFSFDRAERGVFCVREDQREAGEAKAAIVWLDRQSETVLVEGDDFYAAPRPAPDDGHLAWISWSHPDMPWDATRLSLSRLTWHDAVPQSGWPLTLSGETLRCSTVDPVWESAETLLASCDAIGSWRPCRFWTDLTHQPEYLPDPGGETGFPHWVFGQRSLRPLPDGRLMAQIVTEGVSQIGILDSHGWTHHPEIDAAQVPVLFDDTFAWIDTPADAPPAIVIGGRNRQVRQSFDFPEGVDACDCAVPVALSFPSEAGETAHALYYAPVNRTHALAPGEQPPLVVMAHGGPTARANSAFSFKVQWWTSRGFAVLDVNYRGSTGFGRAYREALEGQWGIADVQDCIAAVRHVTAQGLADPKRCVIRGSSAGGLTVLSALASSDVFAAGCSLYGVTDLRALAGETHKFESRYLDRLIGPYPEQEALYLARSPLSHVAEITAPVLFLHGDLDKVVPLAQAQAMHDGLLTLGRHSELHVYEGEGHGFRQEQTLKDSFSRELAFYQRVFAGQ